MVGSEVPLLSLSPAASPRTSPQPDPELEEGMRAAATRADLAAIALREEQERSKCLEKAMLEEQQRRQKAELRFQELEARFAAAEAEHEVQGLLRREELAGQSAEAGSLKTALAAERAARAASEAELEDLQSQLPKLRAEKEAAEATKQQQESCT
ncbi:unnamed protein product [Effrenium voratum]|nr:unnamed protein product [Effrenium voratum]